MEEKKSDAGGAGRVADEEAITALCSGDLSLLALVFAFELASFRYGLLR